MTIPSTGRALVLLSRSQTPLPTAVVAWCTSASKTWRHWTGGLFASLLLEHRSDNASRLGRVSGTTTHSMRVTTSMTPDSKTRKCCSQSQATLNTKWPLLAAANDAQAAESRATVTCCNSKTSRQRSFHPHHERKREGTGRAPSPTSTQPRSTSLSSRSSEAHRSCAVTNPLYVSCLRSGRISLGRSSSSNTGMSCPRPTHSTSYCSSKACSKCTAKRRSNAWSRGTAW